MCAKGSTDLRIRPKEFREMCAPCCRKEVSEWEGAGGSRVCGVSVVGLSRAVCVALKGSVSTPHRLPLIGCTGEREV